jgi:CheY-like chemotaxis protein
MASDSDLHVVAAQLPLQSLKVLVVDDERTSLEVLRYVLEAEGASVVTAGSAAEALSHMDEVLPDVMLVDISMPVVDGFTLVEQLRLRPSESGGNVPVAALTGYLSAEDRERAVRSGFQSYLVKPVEPGELIRAVKTLAAARLCTPA